MDINEYLEKKEELDKAMKSQGKTLVRDLVKNFMEENPTVSAVRWVQYTPYFNDGDACVFSVHETYLSEATDLTDEDFEGYPEETDKWQSAPWDKSKKMTKLEKAHVAFDGAITGKLEDLVRVAFGDHVTVCVLKNDKGEIVFRVEDFDHD